MRIDEITREEERRKMNRTTFYHYCAKAEQDSLALIPSKIETAMKISMEIA
jgi:hypothetical protein